MREKKNTTPAPIKNENPTDENEDRNAKVVLDEFIIDGVIPTMINPMG